MHAIQREPTATRKALTIENGLLRQQLDECQLTLELIMSKYRAQIQQLLSLTEQCSANLRDQQQSKDRLEQQDAIVELSNQMQEMERHFGEHIEAEQARILQEQQEKLKALLVENETLKRLERIANEFGSTHYRPTIENEETPETTDQQMSEESANKTEEELSETATAATSSHYRFVNPLSIRAERCWNLAGIGTTNEKQQERKY